MEDLNWQNVTKFICQRWGMRVKDLAPILGCSASEVSRKNLTNRITAEEIFGRIFDAKNKSALAYGEDEAVLMNAIKDFLKDSDSGDSLGLLWSITDYKIFVTEMLRRANMKPPKRKSLHTEYGTLAKYSENDEAELQTESSAPCEDETIAILADEMPDKQTQISDINFCEIIGEDEHEPQDKEAISQISVPKEFKTCFFCKKWDGNENNARKSPNGVFGRCVMFDKEQLSTGGYDCKHYESNYGRITYHKAYGFRGVL